MDKCFDTAHLLIAATAAASFSFAFGVVLTHMFYAKMRKAAIPKAEPAYRSTKAFRRMQNNGDWMAKHIKERLRARKGFESYYLWVNKEYLGDPVHPNQTPVYVIDVKSTEFFSRHSDKLATIWYDAFERRITIRWCDDPDHGEHVEVILDHDNQYRDAATLFASKFIGEELHRLTAIGTYRM